MNKVTAIIIAILLLMVVGLGIGIIVKTTQDKPTILGDVEPTPLEEQLDMKMENSENIELLASPMTVSEDCVTKTLTAVIIPATAEDKTVDWSVAWADTTKTENVQDYIKVVPTGDGSNVANVNCYKQFTGEIIITVTTRTGGFKAKCTATYIGVPTSIKVSSTLAKNENNVYEIQPNSKSSFLIEQESILGDVKAGGYNNYSITTKGVGSVIYSYYETYRSGGSNWYDTSDTIYEYNDIMADFITITQSGNSIVVETHEPIEDYYKTLNIIDGGRTRAYKDKFRSYVSDCYVLVTVTEKTSGLSTSFKVAVAKQ
ncbi:MAG: hypothetical protein IJD42_07250 [Clostridia bacterium]|nr:hypothetical protein [Clostridia bacterium]